MKIIVDTSVNDSTIDIKPDATTVEYVEAFVCAMIMEGFLLSQIGIALEMVEGRMKFRKEEKK